MSALVVTGTGTEVGKTIVTAAIAAVAMAAGQRVAVVKPAQTGVSSDSDSDISTVARLAGVADVHELVRYPEPLAPATAAARADVAALPMAEMAAAIRRLADHDLVLVEGAGGLLVRLDDAGATVADLAAAIAADVVVVAAASLGTLNATALTCNAIRDRGLPLRGVVIGSWPAQPDLAAIANLSDLPSYAGSPLLGALPEGVGGLDRSTFAAVARRSLAAELGGTWEPASIQAPSDLT